MSSSLDIHRYSDGEYITSSGSDIDLATAFNGMLASDGKPFKAVEGRTLTIRAGQGVLGNVYGNIKDTVTAGFVCQRVKIMLIQGLVMSQEYYSFKNYKLQDCSPASSRTGNLLPPGGLIIASDVADPADIPTDGICPYSFLESGWFYANGRCVK